MYFIGILIRYTKYEILINKKSNFFLTKFLYNNFFKRTIKFVYRGSIVHSIKYNIIL